MSRSSRKTVTISTLVVSVLIWLVVGCNQNRVFEEVSSIPKDGWPAQLLKKITLEIDDTLSYCNMDLFVRNNLDYQYSNLYLFVTIDFPNGYISRDTVDCRLADKYGKWLGDGLGSKRLNTISFKKNILFPAKGTYNVYIEQAMREDTLKGISDVGFRINKVLIEE